jgi:hypothetical protein
MKIRNRHSFTHPIHLQPGDKFICTVTEHGREVFSTAEDIGREMVLDTVVTFDIEPDDLEELGLAEGIGAVFGKNIE